MKCPRCAQAFKEIRYEGVRVETCPGCRGEWLDAGELRVLIDSWETKFSADELSALRSIDKADFTIDPDGHEPVCPKCPGARLERFNYASTSGVALDKCPSCSGLWFDDKELERVQILAEEWSKKLGEDLQQYGSLYRKVRDSVEARVDDSVAVSRFGLFNSILKKLF
jgi:Zn-finger nucleic acid-binding protein